MKYKYEVEAKNYEDFAAGRVLYNKKGATAFPVRLACEIFQRCKAAIVAKNGNIPLRIYDPCCGGAYLLTVLALLHSHDIAQIYASDIDVEMIELAQNNLSLLTRSGILKRINQIQANIDLYNKPSHKAALISAKKMKHRVEEGLYLKAQCMYADILKDDPLTLINPYSIDLVITDVPYGHVVKWKTDTKEPISILLSNLLPVLDKKAVIALISDKKQKVSHAHYRKLNSFKVGKRKITVLELEVSNS